MWDGACVLFREKSSRVRIKCGEKCRGVLCRFSRVCQFLGMIKFVIFVELENRKLVPEARKDSYRVEGRKLRDFIIRGSFLSLLFSTIRAFNASRHKDATRTRMRMRTGLLWYRTEGPRRAKGRNTVPMSLIPRDVWPPTASCWATTNYETRSRKSNSCDDANDTSAFIQASVPSQEPNPREAIPLSLPCETRKNKMNPSNRNEAWLVN